MPLALCFRAGPTLLWMEPDATLRPLNNLTEKFSQRVWKLPFVWSFWFLWSFWFVWPIGLFTFFVLEGGGREIGSPSIREFVKMVEGQFEDFRRKDTE